MRRKSKRRVSRTGRKSASSRCRTRFGSGARKRRPALDSRLGSRYSFGSAEGIKRPLSGSGERKVRTPKDGMAANGGPERSGESATEKRPPSSNQSKTARVKRRGKNSLHCGVSHGAGKPHPEQDRIGGFSLGWRESPRGWVVLPSGILG